MKKRFLASALTLVSTLMLGSAFAADMPAKPMAKSTPFNLYKLSLGVFEHDVDMIGASQEDGYAINFEAQWHSPEFFSIIGAPKPTLGAVIALDAHTTQHAYAGLNWSSQHWFQSPFYIDGFFGLAVLDGNGSFDPKEYNRLNPSNPVNVNDSRKYVGSTILFREAIEIGYRFGARQEHSLSVIASHLSHGEILSDDTRNQGMDHYGVRYGYHF